jgi:hypothetical protein
MKPSEAVLQPRAVTEPADPIAALWVHALRADLDALVTRVQAQVEGHVAATAAARRGELDALAQRAEALATRAREGDAAVAALRAELDDTRGALARARAESAERAAAVEQLTATVAELRDALARRDDDLARLDATLRDVGARARSLDEQFSAERGYVEAFARAAGTLTHDVAQLTFGQPLEATPTCFGALKARKLDAALAAVVRERGRTVTRHPLQPAEREALAAAAHAAGCELIEVPAGQRFASASMEKAATRPEPAEEDHVLDCVMPGLRLAGAAGAAVHPRVVVATA